jgi:hypothetical protein
MRAARLVGGLFLALLALPVAAADTPRQLKWADLVPKSAETENPFLKLAREPLQWISDVAEVRDRRARGDSKLSREDLDKEATAARKLAQAGIDVDALLASRREIAERGRSVNAELDGVTVRLPGYLLPLEFSGKTVTEFLLVPWVGACVHTPPPPPNQLVYVHPQSPVELPEMFAPVWVTGKLRASASTQTLDMIDGSASIDVGYTVHGAEVAPYR